MAKIVKIILVLTLVVALGYLLYREHSKYFQRVPPPIVATESTALAADVIVEFGHPGELATAQETTDDVAVAKTGSSAAMAYLTLVFPEIKTRRGEETGEVHLVSGGKCIDLERYEAFTKYVGDIRSNRSSDVRPDFIGQEYNPIETTPEADMATIREGVLRECSLMGRGYRVNLASGNVFAFDKPKPIEATYTNSKGQVKTTTIKVRKVKSKAK